MIYERLNGAWVELSHSSVAKIVTETGTDKSQRRIILTSMIKWCVWQMVIKWKTVFYYY